MTAETKVKEEVRQFYDSVGWKSIGEGLYQNARYEDLRPVSREYIHRCHMRVMRFIPRRGKYLLDAGSGPIQYPEYLEYSKGYDYRVCLDISILALKEARQRLGDHGLFVQGDIANLPFQAEAFEGVISLHTIHHLPGDEHKIAFFDLYRTLKFPGKGAVVYSWGIHSPLMRFFSRPISWMSTLLKKWAERKQAPVARLDPDVGEEEDMKNLISQAGTFTFKHDYRWFQSELDELPGLDVRVWRTVSTAFLRAFVHRKLLGRMLLRLLFVVEEMMPRALGRLGQYPLILFHKAESLASEER